MGREDQSDAILGDLFKVARELSPKQARQTYYDILGVPHGAGIDYIRNSYRFLPEKKKTVVTDEAYKVLTDPLLRQEYHTELNQEKPYSARQYFDSQGHERWDWGDKPNPSEKSEPTPAPPPPTPLKIQKGHRPKTIEKIEAAGITSLEKLAGMTPEQLMEIPGVDEKVVDAFWLALNRYYNPNWIPQGWEHMSNEELRERIRELTGEDPQHPGWEHMSNEELREMMKKETGEDPGKVRG